MVVISIKTIHKIYIVLVNDALSSYILKLNDKSSLSLIVLAVSNWLNLYIGRMWEKFSISERAAEY